MVQIAAIKLAGLCSDVLLFGLVGLGCFLAFRWLRYPDLTPDGSFVLGAAVYAGSVRHVGIGLAVVIAGVAGSVAGLITALLHHVARVPPVVSGLLAAGVLYSASWLVLGRPNRALDSNESLVGGGNALVVGLVWLSVALGLVLGIAVFCVALLSRTWTGLRMRAVAENEHLSRPLALRRYTCDIVLLAVANIFVALAGAFFAQRSFAADVGSGSGVTIGGLAAVSIALALFGEDARFEIVAATVLVGAAVARGMLFVALEVGVPAELFRAAAALVLLVGFVLGRASSRDVFGDLRWH